MCDCLDHGVVRSLRLVGVSIVYVCYSSWYPLQFPLLCYLLWLCMFYICSVFYVTVSCWLFVVLKSELCSVHVPVASPNN